MTKVIIVTMMAVALTVSGSISAGSIVKEVINVSDTKPAMNYHDEDNDDLRNEFNKLMGVTAYDEEAEEAEVKADTYIYTPFR